MNWTGGKRNAIKGKHEKQKQREFFNRQRLRKVRVFLNPVTRKTRGLPNIDLLFHRRDQNSTSNDEVNNSKNNDTDKINLSVGEDNSDGEDGETDTPVVEQKEQSIITYVGLDFRLRRESAENSKKISDINARKKSILKDIDWAGISSSLVNKPQSSAQFMSNGDEYDDDNVDTEQSDKNEIEISDESSSVNDDIPSTQLEEPADWPNFTIAARPITIESLEWYKFLSNSQNHKNPLGEEEINAYHNKDSLSSTTMLIEKNQIELTKDSESVLNLAWNKFLDEQDNNNETLSTDNEENKKLQNDFHDDDVYDERQYLNSCSIQANYSPQLSLRRTIPTTITENIATTYINYNDEHEHREINLSGNHEDNISIKEKPSTSPLSKDINNNNDDKDNDYKKKNEKLIDRVHQLEIKNVILSIELGFLKDDVRMLKEIINTATTNEYNKIIDVSSNHQQQKHKESNNKTIITLPKINEFTEIPTELITNKTSTTIADVEHQHHY
ncbi:13442_t:CDS:2 [Ambispora leptoticha]|uniref:13442_t:CDS:1 n=1 Tax=Ambispora leptoticha TaxID=144679 RepID=A0A9N8ZQU5_9GLOM|nr:13442_t:CDS:2 [Ambispora leptoticha]